MNEVLDAIRDNPAIGELLGADPTVADRLLSMVLSTFLMMLAMVVSAFVIAAIGSLRTEEDTGRLEGELSGERSRWSWLGVHVAVVALGAVAVGGVGAVALAWSATASTGDDAWVGDILAGSLSYVPTVAVFFAFILLVIGMAPRFRGLGWGLFAAAAVVGYLGPGFDFPEWVVKASPFQAVGSNVLADGMSVAGGVTLITLAMIWFTMGFAGFRRRDIPRS
jgi:ABC-2 type transport system permease protein